MSISQGCRIVQAIDEIFGYRISMKRFARYLDAAGDDVALARILYEWNVELSAELFKLLSTVELILRNALSSSLSALHRSRGGDGNWLLNHAFGLTPHHKRHGDDAIARLSRRGQTLTLDSMIPELNFGFWRYLLAKRYIAKFWAAAFRNELPGVGNDEVRGFVSRVGRLHEIRNRIAHHVPIFGRRLDLGHRDCLLVLGAVCPVTAAWAEGVGRLPEVLAARPLSQIPAG